MCTDGVDWFRRNEDECDHHGDLKDCDDNNDDDNVNDDAIGDEDPDGGRRSRQR